MLLFGADIKITGSLSLLVSFPTMLVAFARYSCDNSFGVVREGIGFVTVMAAGSIAGTIVGGLQMNRQEADPVGIGSRTLDRTPSATDSATVSSINRVRATADGRGPGHYECILPPVGMSGHYNGPEMPRGR